MGSHLADDQEEPLTAAPKRELPTLTAEDLVCKVCHQPKTVIKDPPLATEGAVFLFCAVCAERDLLQRTADSVIADEMCPERIGREWNRWLLAGGFTMMVAMTPSPQRIA
jgi:hypothetical protein